MTTRTLAMSLQAIPQRVGAIRKFVQAYYDLVIRDADLLDRMAMTTHELMENVAKYAADSSSELRIAYRPDGRPPCLEIAVTSRIAPENVAPLLELVERLSSTDDVQALYIQMIRESACREDGSGLGLIRIRAEGEMTLTAEAVGDCVCIRASASVSGPPAKTTARTGGEP